MRRFDEYQPITQLIPPLRSNGASRIAAGTRTPPACRASARSARRSGGWVSCWSTRVPADRPPQVQTRSPQAVHDHPAPASKIASPQRSRAARSTSGRRRTMADPICVEDAGPCLESSQRRSSRWPRLPEYQSRACVGRFSLREGFGIGPVAARLGVDLQRNRHRPSAGHFFNHRRGRLRQLILRDLENQFVVDLQKHFAAELFP